MTNRDRGLAEDYKSRDYEYYFGRTLPAAGKHTVKITVLGEHGEPRGKGAFVYVDGVRIEGAE